MDEERKENLKRDLERLMIAVGRAKRRPVRFYLLRAWRRVVAFVAWPFQFRQRRLEREQSKRDYERIKAELLQSMQQTQAAILESLKQARVFLDELADVNERLREQNALLFASYTPLWSVKGSKIEPTREMIFSEWKFN